LKVLEEIMGKTESIDLEKMMYDLDLDGEADVRGGYRDWNAWGAGSQVMRE
jgi:hypothetical protein